MEEDIETCGWFVFYKDQLLIEKKNGMYTIPFGTEPPMPVPVGSTIHTIGEIEGRTAKTFSVHAPVPGSENDRHLMMDLRSSYDVLPWEEYNVGGKAFQILNWDKNSRYCPMCGVPTVQISPIAKKCPQCRQEIYPRISPAIIVLIRREDSILLVHARNFRGTFNGLVAGFLEPGETLEECVHREVLEETGLHIKNLKYFMIFQSRIYFNHNSVQLEPIFFRGRYIFNGNILFSIDFMVHYVFRRFILVIYLFEFGRRYIHT